MRNLMESPHNVLIASHDAYDGDFTCDSINMKDYHAAKFLIKLDTMAVQVCRIVLWSGATVAALDSALTFSYRIGTTVFMTPTSDVYSDWSSAAYYDVDEALYSDFAIEVYIDASAMDVENQEEWLTMRLLDIVTAGTGFGTVWALLYPRYNNVPGETAVPAA